MFWLLSAAPALVVIGAIALIKSRSNKGRCDDSPYTPAGEPMFTQTSFESVLAEHDTESQEWTM
jgi:hypothetical protein